MTMRFAKTLSMGMLTVFLAACSSYSKTTSTDQTNPMGQPDQTTICKELNRRLMFSKSGITADSAWQHDLQAQQLKNEYHEKGCDQ